MLMEEVKACENGVYRDDIDGNVGKSGIQSVNHITLTDRLPDLPTFPSISSRYTPFSHALLLCLFLLQVNTQ